jgi:hypothetical protein
MLSDAQYAQAARVLLTADPRPVKREDASSLRDDAMPPRRCRAHALFALACAPAGGARVRPRIEIQP